ncbi:large ribosomal subunit protein bL21c [Malania oleifera]|uniref:large ribosomal subunit protein bL21c n=1 Tax=Malania oleifera TaxID=397392 RepID=UPI0025AE2114|nr:large ribosomal subunit protein bL21c [Malania oleifera]
MASAALAFCSPLTTTARLSQNRNPSSVCLSISGTTTSIGFLSPAASLFCPKVTVPPITPSSRPTFLHLPKSSESESPVLEAEPDSLETDPTQVVEAANQVPKREEIFAVVVIGSRQYIVFPGRFIYTQRLKGANVDDKIILNKVLLIGTRTHTWIGKPVVTNAAVHAVVEEQGLDKKVIVFKYKKKKNYRRNIGHRQPITRIRITGITGYQDYPAVTLDS